MRIDAKAVVGEETAPHLDGEKLARYLLQNAIAEKVSVIDVRGLAAADIVSSFVNSLLNTLEVARVDVKRYRDVRWESQFESEASMLRELTNLYISRAKPRPRSAASHPRAKG